MKMILTLCLMLSFSTAIHASDAEEIRQCLNHWGEHPFKGENPKFRTIGARVKVMGIGGEMMDNTKTTTPELILLKPSVTVLGKSVINKIGCKTE